MLYKILEYRKTCLVWQQDGHISWEWLIYYTVSVVLFCIYTFIVIEVNFIDEKGKPNLVFPFPCVVLQTSTPFINRMSFKTVWRISCFIIIAWQVVLGGVKSINVCVYWRRHPVDTLTSGSPSWNHWIVTALTPSAQICSPITLTVVLRLWSCNHHCTALFPTPRPPPPISRIYVHRGFFYIVQCACPAL